MHRVDTSGNIAGAFTDGDPDVPVEATVVDDDWLNAVQESICNLIEDAGITLVKGDDTQLTDAVDAKVAPAIATPTFTYPALANGAQISGHRKLGWSQDAQGYVHIEGEISGSFGTSTTSLWAAGALPPGARPTGTGVQAIAYGAGNTAGVVDMVVGSDGRLDVISQGGTATAIRVQFSYHPGVAAA